MPPLRLAQRWLRDLSYQAMYDYFDRHAELTQAGLNAASSTRMPGNLIDEGMLRAEQGAIQMPTARPYAHPFAWAAFTYSGAMEVSNGR